MHEISFNLVDFISSATPVHKETVLMDERFYGISSPDNLHEAHGQFPNYRRHPEFHTSSIGYDHPSSCKAQGQSPTKVKGILNSITPRGIIISVHTKRRGNFEIIESIPNSIAAPLSIIDSSIVE